MQALPSPDPASLRCQDALMVIPHVKMSFFMSGTRKSQSKKNSTFEEDSILMNILCLSPHVVLFDMGSQQTFSIKGQRVNILGFAGHKVSVATTQLCLVVQKQPQTMTNK